MIPKHVQENLELGKRAIQYLNKLGITSINVPFRLKSWWRSPLSRFDMFLFSFMRAGTTCGNVDHIKRIRTDILKILHSNDSKGQKKKKLTDLMNRVGFDPNTFAYDNFSLNTEHPDEDRIRSARKAIKFRHGNCGEKSAIVCTWLLEQTVGQKKIFWASLDGGTMLLLF